MKNVMNILTAAALILTSHCALAADTLDYQCHNRFLHSTCLTDAPNTPDGKNMPVGRKLTIHATPSLCTGTLVTTLTAHGNDLAISGGDIAHSLESSTCKRSHDNPSIRIAEDNDKCSIEWKIEKKGDDCSKQFDVTPTQPLAAAVNELLGLDTK